MKEKIMRKVMLLVCVSMLLAACSVSARFHGVSVGTGAGKSSVIIKD